MTHTEVCEESRATLDGFSENTLAESVASCISVQHQEIINYLRTVTLTSEPPHYLEESTSGDKQDPIETVEAQLRNGWTTGGGMRVSLKTPPKWFDYQQSSRNVRYKIHSWVMLDSLIIADTITSGREYLDYAVNIADDWISEFVVSATEDEFAWYDMAVGQRATKLAYMLRRLIEIGAPDEQIFRFVMAAEIHFIELLQEERIAMHSNHGLFQMAGLLALSKNLPWMSRSEESCQFAETMLEKMLKEHFANDGLHLEHSPDYHLFMVNHLQSLNDSGWLSSQLQSLIQLVDNVEEAAHWLATPKQHVIAIGDTANNVTMTKRWSGFQNYLNIGHHLFNVGGLVINNSVNPDDPESISQLVFSAQFHSRQHKHADHLNILYHLNNQPLLVDAGTYTYQYDIPERMYCESTRAHNTVEIDELNYSRYRQDAFGSALTLVATAGPCIILEGRVLHSRLIPSTIPNNVVKSTDAIPVDIAHRRIVIEYPNRFVAIIDYFSSDDSHQYVPWYHFDPDLNIREVSQTRLGVFNKDTEKICEIQCYDSESNSVEHTAIKGQSKPNLQGWFCSDGRELTENIAIGFPLVGKTIAWATVFDFKMEKTGQPYIRCGTSGRYLRFALTQSKSKTDVKIISDTDGECSIEVEIDGIQVDVEIQL